MNKKNIIFVLAALFLGLGLFYFLFQKYFIEERSEFIFTAAGDHGLGPFDACVFSGNSMETVANSKSDFYIALGDFSYTKDNEKRWCDTFKSKFKFIELIAGKHDTGEVDGGNIDIYRKYCPFVLPGKMDPILVGDYGKRYYFDYPQTSPALARFILIAPGVHSNVSGLGDLDTYKIDGESYNFVRDAIDQARNDGIKWIVVGMVNNYISTGKKGNEIGHDLMNLLIDKKVDLILQAHDHNYQRSHALKCVTTDSFSSDCIADDGSDGKYVKGVGPVIVINGSFGWTLYNVNVDDPEIKYFANFDDITHGISKYTVSEKQIRGEYIPSQESDFTDKFFITAK